jgi:SnoaL-like domain
MAMIAPREAADLPGSPSRNEETAMTHVNELVAHYIAAWNERDAEKRRALVAQTWSDDGIYIDAHRHGTGHDGIDAMLAATQERFQGYRIGLVSGIEAYGDYVRFSWSAGGTPEAPLYLGGTDFVVRGEDGRFKTVAGFTDAAPAAA